MLMKILEEKTGLKSRSITELSSQEEIDMDLSLSVELCCTARQKNLSLSTSFVDV